MEAIIFIGIPGSGKSTFYRERFFDTHVRINLDMLRTRRREGLLIDACITGGQRYVVDNTNVLRTDREPYIARAKAGHYTVVGYYFPATLSDALRRNRLRTGRSLIPDKGVIAKYHKLQPPSFDEGFDALYKVTLGPDNGFLVDEWLAPPSTPADTP